MLIDFHTHAFADKIAQKAVSQLIDYYGIRTVHDGTLHGLLAEADKARVDALVLLVAATKPSQVKPANDWAVSISRMTREELSGVSGSNRMPRLFPFGTFHPDDPDWRNEIARLRAAGCKGIKLHPEFQGIDLADPRLNDFFEEISRDFIVMMHMGDKVRSPRNLSTPSKLASILDRFPRLKIVAAHMGGYCFWEEAMDTLAGRELYLDTSSTVPFIDAGLFRKLFEKDGAHRIVFGSDYPLSTPAKAYGEVSAFAWLTSAQRDLVFGKNAAALLGIA